jgi:GAF domain-containing protein
LEEILQAAVHAIPPAERGSILLADKDGNLHIRAVWGYHDPRIRGFTFTSGSGYSAMAFRERRAIVINDIQKNAEVTYQGDIVEMFDRGSALAVPLIVHGNPIGVIAIDTPVSAGAFDDRDLHLLQAMASSASLAIENSRLFESTRQRLSEIQAVHTVSSSLRSAHTLDQALPIILDQLMQILGAGAASLDMVDPASGEIVTRLAHGAWAPVTGLHAPSGSGITGMVMTSGEPYVTTDLVSDGKVFRPDLFAGLHTVACVPVIAQHQPIGTLWVGRTTPIKDEEVSLLSAIGEMVGNALHRMRLNEQTERRADQLASLRTIDQAISASLDLRLTLNILLEQVLGHLRVDAADILLLDPNTGQLEPSASRGFRTNSISQFQQQLGDALGNRVARERQLLDIPELGIYIDKFRGALLLKDEEFAAYYGVPLLAKEQLVGVLECFHRAPLQVDTEWIDFFMALAGQAAIAIEKARLMEDLRATNLELTRAYDTTLEGWARALELRDKETEGHSRRVTELTIELAKQFGISGAELVHIRRGVLLHDIGKMGVADQILKKTGPLNAGEWDEMRKHPQYAYDLIYPISYLRPALDIPYCHHEKWDGTGYPRSLSGSQIPLPARIFSVVDVWDALSHDRPYRSAWSHQQVIEYLREQSGKHFDPEVVEKFIPLVSPAR